MKKIIDENKLMTTVPDYLEKLRLNINDEVEAIDSYNEFLKTSNLSNEVIKIITEIRDDEIQHLALLSTLFEDEVVEDFGEPKEYEELTGKSFDEESEEEEE